MEQKNVKLEDAFPVIKEKLEMGGEVTFGPKGTSMLPLIVQGRDTVTLVSPPSKLKKYDLPLYRRKNGQFVLHRVVKVNKDGTYTMCGDNQFMHEPGIEHSDLIGIVKKVVHDGKEYKSTDLRYKVYCRYIVAYRQIRHFAVMAKKKITKACRS